MIRQRLQYGGQDIPYKVCFVPGRLAKIAIHVHPDGSVQVDSPQNAELANIKQAVNKRARWLHNHLSQIRIQYENVLPREYVSGESHFYLGRRFVLKVLPIKGDGIEPSVKLKQGQLQVSTPCLLPNTVRSLLENWYKLHAHNVFDTRLSLIVERLPWITNSPNWKLATMKKQWGSCSPKGTLSINPHLIKAPVTCIDYVLLHELSHLKERNHGKIFYQLLSLYMPDWESAKGRLDGMAELLLNE